jgi:tetratricopeptide (TPR) repeat protein
MIEHGLVTWIDFRCTSVRDLLAIGEYDRAQEKVTELARFLPDHLVLSLLQAEIAVRTRAYNTAIKNYEKLYYDNPSSYQNTELLGTYLCRLGYYHLSSELLETFLSRSEIKHCMCHFHFIFAQIMTGSTDYAENILSWISEVYGQDHEIAPIDATLLALSGLIAYARDDPEEAKRIAGIATATDPSAPFVAFLNGKIAIQQNNYADAIRWMRREIEDTDSCMHARYDLIQLLRKTGVTQRVHEPDILEIPDSFDTPQSPESHESQDILHEIEKLSAELQGFFKEPDTLDEIILSIRELSRMDRNAEAAERALKLISENNPESADLPDRYRLWISEVLLAGGFVDQALNIAESITEPPYNMNVLYLQIMAAIKSRDTDRAMQYLVQVLMRDRIFGMCNVLNYECSIHRPDPVETDQDSESKTGNKYSLPDDIDNYTPKEVALTAVTRFCLNGPMRANPWASRAADTIKKPYYAGFAAIVCLLTDNFPQALAYAEMAESDGTPELMLIRPLIYRAAGLLDEAEEGFASVCVTASDIPTAGLLSAQTRLNRGKWGYAFEMLLLDHAINPGFPVYKPMLLNVRIQAGQFTNFDSITDECIKETPFRIGDYKTLGKALILNHQFEKATWCFGEYIRDINTDDINALFLEIQCMIRAGYYFEAYKNSLRLRSNLDARGFKLFFLTASAALLGGQHDVAQEILKSSPVTFRSEEILRDHLLDLSRQVGRDITLDMLTATPAGRIALTWLIEYEAGADGLVEDIEQIPDDCGLRIAYGECLLHLNRYADALRQFRAAEVLLGDMGESIDTDPRIVSGIRDCRRKLFLHQYCPETIVEELMPLFGNDTDALAQALDRIGKRLDEAGEAKDAAAVFKQITELTASEHPSARFYEMQADAFHNLADITEDETYYDEAVRMYDLAIREDTTCARLYAGKGIVLCNPGRYAEAEIALKEAIRLDPVCGEAYSGLAWCMTHTGDAQRAKYFGDRAVAFAPDQWGAWNNRALAKLASGDTRAAEQDFRTAVFIAPDEIIAARNLHITLMETADEEAIQIHRDTAVRFGHQAAGMLMEKQKDNMRMLNSVFDYNQPEVM